MWAVANFKSRSQFWKWRALRHLTISLHLLNYPKILVLQIYIFASSGSLRSSDFNITNVDHSSIYWRLLSHYQWSALPSDVLSSLQEGANRLSTLPSGMPKYALNAMLTNKPVSMTPGKRRTEMKTHSCRLLSYTKFYYRPQTKFGER